MSNCGCGVRVVQVQGGGSGLQNINGLVTEGDGINVTGSGTSADPYVVENDCQWTVNAGTTADAADDANGTAAMTCGDTLHFWSNDGSVDLSVSEGSAVVDLSVKDAYSDPSPFYPNLAAFETAMQASDCPIGGTVRLRMDRGTTVTLPAPTMTGDRLNLVIISPSGGVDGTFHDMIMNGVNNGGLIRSNNRIMTTAAGNDDYVRVGESFTFVAFGTNWQRLSSERRNLFEVGGSEGDWKEDDGYTTLNMRVDITSDLGGVAGTGVPVGAVSDVVAFIPFATVPAGVDIEAVNFESLRVTVQALELNVAAAIGSPMPALPQINANEWEIRYLPQLNTATGVAVGFRHKDGTAAQIGSFEINVSNIRLDYSKLP